MSSYSNKVPYGKHANKSWSDVPKGYLEFLGNQKEGELPDLCRRELEKRNAKMRDIHISNLAIDSASFCCIELWQKAIRSGEYTKGFLSYITDLAKNSIEVGEPMQNGNILYLGLEFGLEWGKIYPTLKFIRAIKTKPY